MTAQTFTTLHSFTAIYRSPFGYYTNYDGSAPFAGLILSGGTLYGTTVGGGKWDHGTVYKLNTDGTGFTNLHSFDGLDGARSFGMVLSESTIYGATAEGGASSYGNVFALNADTGVITNLHTFSPFYDGSSSSSRLLLCGHTLYGTCPAGGNPGSPGNPGSGTVFKLDTDGTGFTNVYRFTANATGTNVDGANPYGGLILISNTLYGTTSYGGRLRSGTVFAVNTDGTSFTNLHDFTTLASFTTSEGVLVSTNSDGAFSNAELISAGNTLYGTTPDGGNSGSGTVFNLNTDGTGFTNLHSFAALVSNTNADGAYPNAGLILSNNTVYGTARRGGTSGRGTIFAINTNGTGFRTLYSFTASPTNSSGVRTNSDGTQPLGALVLSGDRLYGTAPIGGSFGSGTVFSLSLGSIPPQLTIIRSETNVILTWPTNGARFTLQSTTDLASPASWPPVSPDPAIVNGQNTVTNPISDAQRYYRLSQ